MSARANHLAKRVAGLLALAALLVFLGAPLGLLLRLGASGAAPSILSDPYLRGVVAFTLEQAALSTLVSVLGGVPLALALHRLPFPGRALILRLLILPQALPALVAAAGLVAVWGRNGALSDALSLLGAPRFSVYGLPGILLAHAFFNVPLVARVAYGALQAVPAESWKLAGQLGLTAGAVLRTVEWPAIRTVLPGLAGLVFVLCATSFTLVLVLGGGPAATTMEVAIFQSLRYDFDPARAATLSLLQIGLVSLVLLPTLRSSDPIVAASLGSPARRFDRASSVRRAMEGATLLLGLAFVLSPFAALVANGLRADLARLVTEPSVQRAALTSLAIGGAATALALALALPIAFAGASASPARSGRRDVSRAVAPAIGLAGSLALLVPPIVVGAGWFLLLRRFGDVESFAPFVVALANAGAAVPFVLRILGPEVAATAARHDRLAASLGLFGLSRLLLVDWPALKRPIGLASAFALGLSLGDLGAVALFGSPDLVTLPYLLYQRVGSYRSADADGLALLLGLLCLLLMAAAERGIAAGREGGR